MKLFAPESKGMYVWQVADPKTRAVSYFTTSSR